MKKKHRIFIISIAILSIVHLFFSFNYAKLYGYFNIHSSLNGFIFFSRFFRLLIDGYIALCGFIAVLEDQKKILPIYLIFLGLNFILPFVFAL